MTSNAENQPANEPILYDINEYVTWINEIDLNKVNSICFLRNDIIHRLYSLIDSIYIKGTESYHLAKLLVWIKNHVILRNNETALKLYLAAIKPWNQWRLSISRKGTVAVLQENCLEVFADNDSYIDYIWRKELKTKFPQLCCLEWNCHSNILLVVNEDGCFYFYDDIGKELLQYSETESLELENALNRVIFMDEKYVNETKLDDVIEIILTSSYSGYLNVYSLKSDYKLSKLQTISLNTIFPNGIYCSEIDNEFQYLFIGSFTGLNKKSTNAAIDGISVWRLVNTEPWLKLVFLTESKNQVKPSTNPKIPECVTKLSVSPNNSIIAVIYNSGKLALYSIPNLNHKISWTLDEQSYYKDINSDIMENPNEMKQFKKIYQTIDYSICDIGWWNENVLITSRGTGLLSLSSTNDLTNLMGQNQQWLSPYATLYHHPRNGFIVLDCSCNLLSQSSLNDADEQNSDAENDTIIDDFDEDTWSTYAKQFLKSQAYNLSGIERFKPPEKKPRFLKRTFQLLHFKSTTPEELFNSKLNAEEYGEALQLAKRYNLDADLVYQKQWRSKPMTKATINDYLSKIKKRSWILHECLERVPIHIDSAKALIDFGLRGTDIDSLLAIKDRDDNNFVYSQTIIPDDLDNDDIDIFNPRHIKEQKEKIKRLKMEKVKQLDLNNLTATQKDLCRIRVKLLTYLDRLSLYEQILGGKSYAADRFEAEKFQKIRTQPIIEMAIDYAREGNVGAIELIFAFHHDELKNEQLNVLGNFSETQDPNEYESLLPKIKDNNVQIYENTGKLREDEDWVERVEVQDILSNNNSGEQATNDEEFYTKDKVEKWYENRVYEIESYTGLIDNSLKFCEIAIRNGCLNLSQLQDNLLTLFTIIYECKTKAKAINLSKIKSYDSLKKLSFIMEHCEDSSANDIYTKRIQDWLIPYLTRRSSCEEREFLIRSYLIQISKTDLNPCFKILQLRTKLQQQYKQLNKTLLKSISNEENSNRLAYDLLKQINVIQICIDCLYTNENIEQLDLCVRLVAQLELALQIESTIIKNLNELLMRLPVIQIHLKCVNLYRKYGINATLKYIGETLLDEVTCRSALVKLTWCASKSKANLKQPDWDELMKDIQYLHKCLYKDLINYQSCNEIFLSCLLGTRNLDNIKLASTWLKDIYSVDKESAIKLIIKSTQDYYNSASSYYDPDMDFARACLNLIDMGSNSGNDANLKLKQLIDEEYNLINAMKLINDFSLALLPVQVRLNENRIEIIKDILNKNRNSYKEYEKILQLARLLSGVSQVNSNEFECEIMLPICENALENDNLQISMKMCDNMMQYNYSRAWSCTYSLAKKLINQNKSPLSSNDERIQIISSIKNIYNKQFNSTQQNYLNEINDLLKFSLTHCDNDYIEEILGEILKLEEISTIDTTSNEQSQYERVELPTEQIDFKYNLQTNDELERINALLKSNSLNAVNELFKLDVKIAIAYLLELNVNELEQLTSIYQFDSCLAYEFFLYILSLNILNDEKQFQNKNFKSLLYYISPSVLNEHVYSLGLHSRLAELFNQIYVSYLEFKQIEELDKLNIGIDVKRFKHDNDYRMLTINGLATMDDEKFQFACLLAKFYKINLFEIYMCYIENLFLQANDADLHVGDFEAKLRPLLDFLNKDKVKFHDYLERHLFGQIGGTELNKLICFYGLFDTDVTKLHIKLICKIKSLIKTFDYKLLLEKPFETINGLVDETNVQLFAKVSNVLSSIDKNLQLDSSKIYKIWYLKTFWLHVSENLSDIEEEQKQTQKICEYYETIKENFKKLSSNDFIDLLNELILSEVSIEMLSLHTRKELLKRLVKFFKKSYSNIDLDEMDGIQKEFTQMQTHLKLIESVGKIGLNYEKSLKNQLDFYLYQNNFDKIEQTLCVILIDTYDIENINELVKMLSISGIHIKSLIKSTLKYLCKEIKISKKEKNLNKLKILLESIAHYIEKNTGKINLQQDDIIDCMREFCNDTEIQLNIRLNILEELKNIFPNMSEADLMLLIVYKTNAIFDSCNCFGASVAHVKSSDISDEEKRCGLFKGLLDAAKSEDDCTALFNLLKIWPKFKSSSEAGNNLWNLVLIKFITLNVSFCDCMAYLKSNEEIGEDDVNFIKTQVSIDTNGVKVACLKLHLQYQHIEMIKEYLADIDFCSLLAKNFTTLLTDTELIGLLSDGNFYLKLIDTPLFSLYVEFILKNETNDNVLAISRLLNDKGHFVEASKLLAHTKNSNTSYTSLSFSLELLKKFF